MTRFNRITCLAALLLGCSAIASADDLQDASKLYKLGQSSLALAKVETILAAQPKEVHARFLKAVILNEQGQADEAAKIFSELTVEQPGMPEPYNNLAAIYASQGNYEKAKSALEAALRTHPSYATAYENLGDIYAKMASQAYDKALQLDRSSSNSKTRLAMIKEITPVSSKPLETKTQIASLTKTPVSKPVSVPASNTTTTIAAAETPPAKADVAPVTTTAAPGNDEAVLKAVQEWAKAWSSRNANKYLAMYAKEFKTPNNESRSIWEQQRRERIAKPQPISVTISNAKVKMVDETHASVSFIQQYRSGSLKSITRKTLEMVKNNGNWQILAEVTGS